METKTERNGSGFATTARRLREIEIALLKIERKRGGQ